MFGVHQPDLPLAALPFVRPGPAQKVSDVFITDVRVNAWPPAPAKVLGGRPHCSS